MLSVSVGDEKLPNMTSESQIQVSGGFTFTGQSNGARLCVCAALTWLNFNVCFQALHSALHTFDMMESVLVRIEELTEVKENL